MDANKMINDQILSEKYTLINGFYAKCLVSKLTSPHAQSVWRFKEE